jgi:SAM-dependent methyltransferase
MDLEKTGERLIESRYLGSPGEYLIYLFHRAAYSFAREHLGGKTVLDYGCGTGLGSAVLAEGCRHITAIDISPEAIAYAREKYPSPNICFRQAEPLEKAPLPFADGSFEGVVSLQVIEHLADPGRYLAEISRVLKPGGVVIVATPDRDLRLLPFQKPWNMWHIREFSFRQFDRLLKNYFCSVQLYRMGGTTELLGIELTRIRLMKWLTLPLTLPFTPERIRIAGLSFLKKLRGARAPDAGAPASFDFNESALEIAPDAPNSMCLLACASKKKL